MNKTQSMTYEKNYEVANVEWLTILKMINLIVASFKIAKLWNVLNIRKWKKLKDNLTKLQTEINSYGKKVRSYKDLHILIDNMFGVLDRIKILDRREHNDSDFWDVCAGLNDSYQLAYDARFSSFNSDVLNPEHKGKIDVISELLRQEWGVMANAFNANRRTYMEAVRVSAEHCIKLMGFTYMILDEITQNLENFSYQ